MRQTEVIAGVTVTTGEGVPRAMLLSNGDKLAARRAELVREAEALLDTREDGTFTTTENQIKYDSVLRAIADIDGFETRPATPTGASVKTLDTSGLNRAAAYGTSTGQNTAGFDSLGDLLQAVGKSWHPQKSDSRLSALRQLASINESIGSEGGFGIPTEFIDRILADANPIETPMLALCDKQVMRTDSCTVPRFADDSHATSPFGITWSKIAEGATFGNAQSVSMAALKLTAKKHGAYFSVSNEWLDDASAPMRRRLEDAFVSSLRWYIESKLWNGDGGGEPTGVLTAPGTLTIDKESGQAADTIVTANIVKMWARLRGGSHGRAIWCANATTCPMLAQLSITVGTGGAPVGLLQPSGIANGPAMSILGRPLYLSEHLPALGDEGDIALVDPLLYMLGDRQGVTVDASPHARHQYDETCFRVKCRIDGMPILSSTLTPKNGDTQGWAVVVEAR